MAEISARESLDVKLRGYWKEADRQAEVAWVAAALPPGLAHSRMRARIERRTDADLFGFAAGAGGGTVTVPGAKPAPNLNSQSARYEGFGNLVPSVNPGLLRVDAGVCAPGGKRLARLNLGHLR